MGPSMQQGTVKFSLGQLLPCTGIFFQIQKGLPMEQRTFKNVNNCLNTNIYFYLETSGGQSFNPYLNAVHFFNTRVK